ncbi:hypothetical protein A3G14_04140 [Candidatus Curtissbacteria bacterium RIFCSPLOWO2_12_FULL_38_9]|uniref:Glycosyltransferase RgtA/B/C/D-like domain-containing protein n=1 Tax=Candidatus Curtissbacteria bacterium RIFCSPLOWO2_12_FULL_38_9 TaxID=1797735 RepID=A0A1F5I783_9BACT|nr:MAG: hypothetical protein A3G14_04140 [Candidatus Curtissbacteria bacterium RIFCSPLOWO2_12_FULL_38_9]
MILLIMISVLGIGFIGIFPKKIPFYLKLLVAPSLGLIVFTSMSLYLSFLLGLDLLAIILSLLICGILSVLSHIKFPTKINFFGISRIFIVSSLVVLISISYLMFSQTLKSSAFGIESGGGGLYGDSALHAAYTSRLATGEFPPTTPLFAGKTLVYPFANDLLSATLRKFQTSFNLSFVFPQVIFLIAVLSLIYQIVRKFSDDRSYATALILLLLGWGIGAFFYISDLAVNGNFNVLGNLTKDYTNNPDFNLHLHNIVTGLILPERSLLPGLVIGLMIFLFSAEYMESFKLRFILLSGLLLGILPFWHTHTFIYFVIFFLTIGTWQIIKTRSYKIIRDLIFSALVALFAALPFIILFLLNLNPMSFLRFESGWQNGGENLIVFWFKNSFLIIPLSILGFLTIAKEKRIYFIPAYIAFLISNIIIFQPWEWDNIKLLTWSFLFFSVLTAIYLSNFFNKNFLFKIIISLLILFSSLSGILSITLQFKNKFVIYDQDDIALADWANTNTSIDDVFIIDPRPNHPIPGLTGRISYIGYPGHLWVHGIDYSKREIENTKLLSGDFSNINNLAVSISYVVFPNNSYAPSFPSLLTEVYLNQKYQVLKVKN